MAHLSKYSLTVEQNQILELKSQVSRLELENSNIRQRLNQQNGIVPTRPSQDSIGYTLDSKGNFELAVKLLSKPCSHVLVMQRSSSLVLGAEKGWNGESKFYDALIESVQTGVQLSHVVSIEDSIHHLRRNGCHFPDALAAIEQFHCINGNVHISGGGRTNCIKRMPRIPNDPLFKLDRQARTVLVEYEDRTCEGIMVTDLGAKQGWFTLQGITARKFMKTCYEFYCECEKMDITDLERIKNEVPQRQIHRQL